MGWYIVWRQASRAGNGASSGSPTGELPPALYFCVEASSSDVQCMSARPSEDEEFLPVCHESFAGALWLGPFKTRREAMNALEAAAS